ncbi:MAG TPA: hypothetical protein VKV26_05300 [Dehalococcoidia bacterium]|nr:hypothetical protein [Dehalococcoidia bacterium]
MHVLRRQFLRNTPRRLFQGEGNGGGRTPQSCSPRGRNGSRLVAISVMAGQAPGNAAAPIATGLPAAPRRGRGLIHRVIGLGLAR